jgi:hypothetical protein
VTRSPSPLFGGSAVGGACAGFPGASAFISRRLRCFPLRSAFTAAARAAAGPRRRESLNLAFYEVARSTHRRTVPL